MIYRKRYKENKQSWPIFDSKIPAYTKTENVYQNKEIFFIQKPGLSTKKKALAECSTISVLPTKAAKVWFNKNIVRNTEQQKPLAPDFQIQVNELEHKIKFLNEKFTAGGVYEHINN